VFVYKELEFLQGGLKIVSHYRIINESHLIVLKPANGIIFFRQLKVSSNWSKYYNIWF